jgi:hypothetical protein
VALAAQRWAAAMKGASTYEGPLLATQFRTSYSLTMFSCGNSQGTTSIGSNIQKTRSLPYPTRVFNALNLIENGHLRRTKRVGE